jgi:tRNA threonylcarbamoyladenosine biosynthesis protein TsaE
LGYKIPYSIAMQISIRSESKLDTEKIAEVLGRNLKGGEVIELVSDVGGGKTAFVRGLSRGAGSQDHVNSPTYTIANIYKTPNFAIHHLDFYRLENPGLIEHELKEQLADKQNVVVVEWSDIVEHVLPETRLTIHIKTTGENSRQLEFICEDKLSYLIQDVDINY